jgi:hypothetical protein
MIEIEQWTDAEQKLWGNVLLQALTDLSGRDPFARSARLWFSSRDESIGSLAWICDHLSLDRDAVRQRVLKGANQRRQDSLDSLAEETTRAA